MTAFKQLEKSAEAEEPANNTLRNLAVGGIAGAGAAGGAAATGVGLTATALADFFDSGKAKMLISGTPIPRKPGYKGLGKVTSTLLRHPNKTVAGGGAIAALLAGLAADKVLPHAHEKAAGLNLGGIASAFRGISRSGAMNAVKRFGGKASEFGQGLVAGPVNTVESMLKGNMPMGPLLKTRTGQAGELTGLSLMAASPFALGHQMMKDKGQATQQPNNGRPIGAIHPDLKKSLEAGVIPDGRGGVTPGRGLWNSMKSAPIVDAAVPDLDSLPRGFQQNKLLQFLRGPQQAEKAAARGDYAAELVNKSQEFRDNRWMPTHKRDSVHNLQDVMRQQLERLRGMKKLPRHWPANNNPSLVGDSMSLVRGVSKLPKPADATTVGLVRLLRSAMK